MENKKTTAPNASVGADAGQPSVKTNTEIVSNSCAQSNLSEEEFMAMCRKMDEINSPGYLHMVSHNELLDTPYVGKQAIIDDLLYTGAYILAGAPKIGKSFLVAQLAYHVSTGQPLWGYNTRQGDVLYLALEDDEKRLQERMYRMFGVNGTDRLRFATAAKQLGNGLDEQLEFALHKYPETKLVIVDTLQKVREVTSENYSYASDYQVIGALKSFADKHSICILIVHHTRKQPAGDSFEKISGTTGLLGCADGSFLLEKEKRTSSKATLSIVGRDQPDQQLYLVKNQERLIWELERKENELWKEPPDPLLEAISRLFHGDLTEWQGSATELITLLNVEIQPNILTRKLNVKAGELLSEYQIQYTAKRTREGSSLCLKLLAQSV